MRPIDADALKSHAYVSSDWSRGGHPFVVEVDDIDEMPTITLDDLRPNGEWIERQYALQWCEDDVDIFYECSACQEEFLDESLYCPNCGAKMGGGE